MPYCFVEISAVFSSLLFLRHHLAWKQNSQTKQQKLINMMMSQAIKHAAMPVQSSATLGAKSSALNARVSQRRSGVCSETKSCWIQLMQPLFTQQLSIDVRPLCIVNVPENTDTHTNIHSEPRRWKKYTSRSRPHGESFLEGVNRQLRKISKGGKNYCCVFFRHLNKFWKRI